MIETLKEAAVKSGADAVIYDVPSMQNVLADTQAPGRIICMIDELWQLRMRIIANGVQEDPMIRVRFVYQVELLGLAEDRRDIMNTLLTCCRRYLLFLVEAGKFGKNIDATVRKMTGRENDQNLQGWAMDLRLNEIDGYAECTGENGGVGD